jgi:hypothetical protein
MGAMTQPPIFAIGLDRSCIIKALIASKKEASFLAGTASI